MPLQATRPPASRASDRTVSVWPVSARDLEALGLAVHSESLEAALKVPPLRYPSPPAAPAAPPPAAAAAAPLPAAVPKLAIPLPPPPAAAQPQGAVPAAAAAAVELPPAPMAQPQAPAAAAALVPPTQEPRAPPALPPSAAAHHAAAVAPPQGQQQAATAAPLHPMLAGADPAMLAAAWQALQSGLLAQAAAAGALPPWLASQLPLPGCTIPPSDIAPAAMQPGLMAAGGIVPGSMVPGGMLPAGMLPGGLAPRALPVAACGPHSGAVEDVGESSAPGPFLDALNAMPAPPEAVRHAGLTPGSTAWLTAQAARLCSGARCNARVK